MTPEDELTLLSTDHEAAETEALLTEEEEMLASPPYDKGQALRQSMQELSHEKAISTGSKVSSAILKKQVATLEDSAVAPSAQLQQEMDNVVDTEFRANYFQDDATLNHKMQELTQELLVSNRISQKVDVLQHEAASAA